MASLYEPVLLLYLHHHSTPLPLPKPVSFLPPHLAKLPAHNSPSQECASPGARPQLAPPPCALFQAGTCLALFSPLSNSTGVGAALSPEKTEAHGCQLSCPSSQSMSTPLPPPRPDPRRLAIYLLFCRYLSTVPYLF